MRSPKTDDIGDEPITQLLTAATQGDSSALDRLLGVLYEELRKLAGARVGRQPPGQSLRPTDLVHEAYIKLLPMENRSWENRCHFINAAGAAMRSVIVDRARARNAAKRGGDLKAEPLEAGLALSDRDPCQTLAIDEAVSLLAEADERAAQVVTLRVFLGLSELEIAEVLGVTDRTVQRDWKFARAWLAAHLGEKDANAL